MPVFVLAQWVAALGLEILPADPWAAHHEVAERLAIPRQLLAQIVDDLHVDAVNGPALLVLQRQALLAVPAFVPGLEGIHRTQRAHLCHAPGVDDLDTVIRFEAADHRGGASRAADHGAFECAEAVVILLHEGEQAQPDRRHPGRDRHFLLLEQLEHARPVETGAGKHHLGADHGRAVRQAPGIDVEHGYHRQDDVAGGDVQRVRHTGRVAVDEGAAVAVEYALRVTRRAGGVAQGRGRPFIEVRPLEIGRIGIDQVLVTQRILQFRRRHVRLVGHEDPALHAGALVGDGLGQRHEGEVDEDVAILRMVDDVDDLLGEKARIDGMGYGAHAGHRVIGLQVAEAVPGQGGDPVVHPDAQGSQRVRQLAGAAVRVAVGVAVNAAFHHPGNDFSVAVVAVRVLDQRRDQQRHIHHQALHRGLLLPVHYWVADSSSLSGRAIAALPCKGNMQPAGFPPLGLQRFRFANRIQCVQSGRIRCARPGRRAKRENVAHTDKSITSMTPTIAPPACNPLKGYGR